LVFGLMRRCRSRALTLFGELLSRPPEDRGPQPRRGSLPGLTDGLGAVPIVGGPALLITRRRRRVDHSGTQVTSKLLYSSRAEPVRKSRPDSACGVQTAQASPAPSELDTAPIATGWM
jgi:hypothetical protein